MKKVLLLLRIEQILNMTEENSKPILFSQEHLNNLIRDLALSKQKAELLASRLQENNLLHADVVVTHYRKHNMDLLTVFRVDRLLCTVIILKVCLKNWERIT